MLRALAVAGVVPDANGSSNQSSILNLPSWHAAASERAASSLMTTAIFREPSAATAALLWGGCCGI
jgi:hypothetical protein